MSDRLAVSASFSVLMMSIYVLFGADAAREPFGPRQLAPDHAISAQALPANPAQSLLSSR